MASVVVEKIPTTLDNGKQSIRVQLANVTYTIDLLFSRRNEAWYVTVTHVGTGSVVVSSVRASVFVGLTAYTRSPYAPAGELALIHNNGLVVDADLADLGRTHSLAFIPTDQTI